MIAKDQATVDREVADQEAEAEFQAGTDDTGPTVKDVEVEPGVTTGTEAAPTGVDATGEAVDMPAAPTTAEVVIEDTTPREAPVLEYAETTVNPEGVPVRIYEDPDTPGLNIVESEGVVLKKSTDRASAVTYANTNVTAETVKRKTPKAQAAPKARPEGKTYTGPKPKGASESLVKWMGGTAPFRATIGKQRASQARKVGLDPDQYTTEEELYDAIVAQVEAEPVEVVEPAADIAEEVQQAAEEIVPETNLERIAREATERRVKENAIMVEQDFTPEEIAEMEQFEDREVESGLMEDIDADIEAEIAAEEARSEAARATRKLEIESEKVSFETVDNMEVADFLQLAQTPRKPGWSKQQLVQIANNIQANDPTVSFDIKKKRADLAQELIAWKESGVTIDDSILEPEYQDDVTSDGDFYRS
jgi:histone H3/H4